MASSAGPKRPNNVLAIVLGGVIMFFPAMWVSDAFRGQAMKFSAFLVTLAAGPTAFLVSGYRKWGKYIQQLSSDYEKAKDAVRLDPADSRKRELALDAGRRFYSCLNEGLYFGTTTPAQEISIANDLKALIG